MNCPACQSLNPPSMKFCVTCGLELATAPVASKIERRPAHAEDGTACPSCGKATQDEAMFCSGCGFTLGVNPGSRAGVPFQQAKKPSWWLRCLWWLSFVGFLFFCFAFYFESQAPQWQREQEWLAKFLLLEKAGILLFGGSFSFLLWKCGIRNFKKV